MDPLALSGAFATIVGLLANFRGERSSADLSEFISWLRERHHEQVADAIAQNRALSGELSSLLAKNHQELTSQLTALHEQMTNVALQVEGFAGLASVFLSVPQLSAQAKSVIKQIVQSGARSVMEHELHTGDPTEFIFIGSVAGKVHYAEPAFINEDLDALVSANLLRVAHTSDGKRTFSPTRAGVEYAQRSDG